MTIKMTINRKRFLTDKLECWFVIFLTEHILSYQKQNVK